MEMLDSRVHSCGTFSRLQFGRERRAVSWYLFWVGSVNHHSHRLRLKQSQTKGKGWPPEGNGEGKVASGCCARCVPTGSPGRGRGKGQSQEHRRGAAGVRQGCTRPRGIRGQTTPPCPRSRLTRPLEYLWRPRTAERHRVIMGTPGGRQQRARGPPVCGCGVYGAREPRMGLAAKTRARDAAANPASALPRAAVPRLCPRPRPSARPASGSASRSAPLPVPPPPPPTSCPAPPQGRIQQDPAESLASSRVG